MNANLLFVLTLSPHAPSMRSAGQLSAAAFRCSSQSHSTASRRSCYARRCLPLAKSRCAVHLAPGSARRLCSASGHFSRLPSASRLRRLQSWMFLFTVIGRLGCVKAPVVSIRFSGICRDDPRHHGARQRYSIWAHRSPLFHLMTTGTCFDASAELLRPCGRGGAGATTCAMLKRSHSPSHRRSWWRLWRISRCHGIASLLGPCLRVC